MDERRAERHRRGELDADAHTTETVDSREGPARPGTSETGLPDREQLRGERMDLEETLHQRTRRREDESDLPSQKERGRMDRKELTGQRAQDEDRGDAHDVDSQGDMGRHTAPPDLEDRTDPATGRGDGRRPARRPHARKPDA